MDFFLRKSYGLSQYLVSEYLPLPLVQGDNRDRDRERDIENDETRSATRHTYKTISKISAFSFNIW